MILNKFFKGFVVLVLCAVSATSCVNEGNNSGGTIKPSDCKPGDDFFTYANAEWLESLGNKNSKKWHGYLYEISDATEAKVQIVQESMPEMKALAQGGANLKKNEKAATALAEKIVKGLLSDAETKEDAYVAFGKAIRLGVPSVATLYTGICREDNTFGFYFLPPIEDMASVSGVHRAAEPYHHVVSKRLNRYVPSTRSGKTPLDYVFDGIGLDPKYSLNDELAAEIIAALEAMDRKELLKSIGEALLTEYYCHISDENVRSITGGQIKSVQEYINQNLEGNLGYRISYNFSQAYPTDDVNPAFIALGEELTESFRKRLENNKWLSPSTQQAALEKLDYMRSIYGTPKKWPVTEPLPLKGEILLADMMEIKQSRVHVIESLLGKNVDEYLPIYYMFHSPLESMYSFTPNAFYDRAVNSFYVLPPYMMEPAYTADIDECKLYAIWGVAIGHEMTHGFDKEGATYDKNGEKNDWWTEGDAAKFAELNARRAANVSTHNVLPGMKANGEQTVTEDVADLGGFNIAYDLWVNKLKERGIEGEELNDMKRQFFLNFAVLYSEKLPRAAMIERAKEDVHSAGHIRINSVVQHIDDWYELFDVTEGDALYLAPEQRITIW